MRAGPVLYDLRRSALRVSTLVLLALAVLAGVGVTYLLRVALLQGGLELEDVNFVGALVVGRRAYLVGAAFDSRGEPLAGLRVELYLGDRRAAGAATDGRGLVVSEVGVEGLGEQVVLTPSLLLTRDSTSLSVSGVPRQGPGGVLVVAFKRASAYVLDEGVRVEAPGQSRATVPLAYLDAVVLEMGSGRVSAVVFGFSFDGESVLALDHPICYNVTRVAVTDEMGVLAGVPLAASYTSIPVPANATMVCYGPLEGFWSRLDLQVPEGLTRDPGARLLVLGLGTPGDVRRVGSLFSWAPRILRAATISLTSAVNVALTLFAVAAVYLPNQLMARPRSSGELEFVLSGPVTRADLFATRYLAQLVAFATMSSVLVVALQSSGWVLLGSSFDAVTLARIFAAAFLTSAAFLSLTYSVASSVRPGLYMALAMAAYIVFMLFWDTLMYIVGVSVYGLRSYREISEFASRSIYFNPRVAGAFFMEQVQTSILGGQGVLDPALAAVSTLVWIVVPPVLAYLRFRRIPLYSL